VRLKSRNTLSSGVSGNPPGLEGQVVGQPKTQNLLNESYMGWKLVDPLATYLHRYLLPLERGGLSTELFLQNAN